MVKGLIMQALFSLFQFTLATGVYPWVGLFSKKWVEYHSQSE